MLIFTLKPADRNRYIGKFSPVRQPVLLTGTYEQTKRQQKSGFQQKHTIDFFHKAPPMK